MKKQSEKFLGSKACERDLNIAKGIFVDGKMVPRAWKKTASFPEFPSSSLMNQGDLPQPAGAST